MPRRAVVDGGPDEWMSEGKLPAMLIVDEVGNTRFLQLLDRRQRIVDSGKVSNVLKR